jgi:hypothetical protein
MRNRPERHSLSSAHQAARVAAFQMRPRPDLWSDEELAVELLKRLEDFSPALSIGAGDGIDQVVVEITMSRSPKS